MPDNQQLARVADLTNLPPLYFIGYQIVTAVTKKTFLAIFFDNNAIIA